MRQTFRRQTFRRQTFGRQTFRRLAAATVVASLAWTACSAAGPAAPVRLEPGQSVSLKPGESAQAADGSLRFGFDGVTSDSRCPKGEQCVWAGNATVRVWLQRGSGPRQTRELHAAPRVTPAAGAADDEVQLLRLDPYPVTRRPIARQDYVATLALNRNAAAAAER